jgi:spore coat protein U-like protein
MTGIRAVVAMLLFAVSAPAIATATCGVSAPALAFGPYDVFAGTQVTSSSTVSVTCTLVGSAATTVNYTVALSSGSSGTFVQRTMKSGAAALGYNLYSDTTRTTVWGDGTGSAPTVSGTMKLKNSTPVITDDITAYGSVPALQDALVGAYSDNITITVSY